MCCLKIGREFDAHLNASEVASEVCGLARSLFRGGRFLLTSPLVSSCWRQLDYRGSVQLLRISAPALGRDLNCLAFTDDGWHFL